MTRSRRFASYSTQPLSTVASGGSERYLEMGDGSLSVTGAFQVNAFQNNAFQVAVFAGGGSASDRDFLDGSASGIPAYSDGVILTEVGDGEASYARASESDGVVLTAESLGSGGRAGPTESGPFEGTDATGQPGGAAKRRRDGSTSQTSRRRL